MLQKKSRAGALINLVVKEETRTKWFHNFDRAIQSMPVIHIAWEGKGVGRETDDVIETPDKLSF